MKHKMEGTGFTRGKAGASKGKARGAVTVSGDLNDANNTAATVGQGRGRRRDKTLHCVEGKGKKGKAASDGKAQGKAKGKASGKAKGKSNNNGIPVLVGKANKANPGGQAAATTSPGKAGAGKAASGGVGSLGKAGPGKASHSSGSVSPAVKGQFDDMAGRPNKQDELGHFEETNTTMGNNTNSA